MNSKKDMDRAFNNIRSIMRVFEALSHLPELETMPKFNAIFNKVLENEHVRRAFDSVTAMKEGL